MMRDRRGGGTVARRHGVAGITGPELRSLGEIRGRVVAVGLRKLVGDEQHCEPRGTALGAARGVEGESQNDEAMQQTRQEQRGQQPVPNGGCAFTQYQGTQRHEGSFSDRKSTRLNSSHDQISYAVFCLKKKKKITRNKMISTD